MQSRDVNFNTRYVRTFLIVARLGSVAEAARHLNLTQGAVSQQIRSLEQELDVQLVKRAGRTVSVTEAGASYIAPMHDLLAQVDSLKNIFLSKEIAGDLKVGAGITVLRDRIPSVLSYLVQTYPALNLSLQAETSPNLYEMLNKDKIDVAIAMQPSYQIPKYLNWEKLYQENYMIVAHESHAKKDPYQLLRTEPFIHFTKSEWGGILITNYLKKLNINSKQNIEVGIIESIEHMISRNIGVSILPITKGFESQYKNIISIEPPEKIPPRVFGLAYKHASPKQSLAEAFKASFLHVYPRR